jgi:hypothetical protein
MRSTSVPIGVLSLVSGGCLGDRPDAADPTAGTGDETSTGEGDPGQEDAGELFDVAPGNEGGGDEASADGCRKIDFLFVIDNSGSMADEQAQLVASFPAFMATIEQTLEISDYQILATDTDAASVTSKYYCGGSGCCDLHCGIDLGGWCCELVDAECEGGALCTPPADACDVELGAGLDDDATGADCGFFGGHRYLLEGEPDLPGGFACAALVGTDGDSQELVAEAMLAAVGPSAQPGGCNAGFLRNDAILVVTLITDEGDSSQGTAAQWHDALVAAKGGDEQAVVLLSLVGDSDLDDATCAPFQEGGMNFGEGARPAPRFRELAESFPHGRWGSVCADDYGPFFADAVADVDLACEEFVPPG